jgi:hypothetical protein
VTSLTLLILCLAAWGWGTLHVETIWFESKSGLTGAELYSRGISFFAFRTGGMGTGWTWWHNSTRDPQVNDVVGSYGGDDAAILGFAIIRPTPALRISIFRFPWWFLIFLTAALTWWTWRKRRNGGDRGFAVDAGREPPGDAGRDAVG